MDGLTSCLPAMSLACYSDRPGPLPLLIGATAAALSCGTAAASLWLCGPWKAMGQLGVVYSRYLGPNLALLGSYHGQLGGLPPNLHTPKAPWKVENNSKSLCCPQAGAAKQSNSRPKAASLAYWA